MHSCVCYLRNSSVLFVPFARSDGSFSSTHRADFIRLDLIEDAHFAWLAERVDGFAQILLRKFIDVIIGAGLGNFDDAAANLQIAIGVRWILERNGNARI